MSKKQHFSKNESLYRKKQNSIKLVSMNPLPNKDYDQTQKKGSYAPEEFGASVKPDYDSDPESDPRQLVNRMGQSRVKHGKGLSEPGYSSDHVADYGESRRPKKIINSDEFKPPATRPKPASKRPLGGVPIFSPISQEDASSTGNVKPIKSSLKKGKENVVDVKVDDPLLVQDLANLPELSLQTISDCIEQRYQRDLIYTNCGEILISVNPFKDVELCSPKYFSEYSNSKLPETSHLFGVSAKAYQNIKDQEQNQVILVSGESGAGKTEATKLLVRHLISIGGSEYPHLQERIIEINPLLEAFGNAKTRLNKNSSRFAKFLSLNINKDGKVESALVKDYMLEKSRVVHQEEGERNFHSFYAFLTGASDDTLRSVYINRSEKFRILGKQSTLSTSEKQYYQSFYKSNQAVFKLIKLSEEEIQDVNIILSAVLHLGQIEFQESDNDCVIIKNEDVVHTVATLLQLDALELTKIFLERSAKLGKSEEIITLSKNKKQAEDERDATGKALYERMFGWLVRRVNDSLKAEEYKGLPSIGILDICGFENLTVNSLEQLCINLVNEHLQNFMNKMVIEEETKLYENEGIKITDVDITGINNDTLIFMFMKKNGILDLIDEDTKSGFSTDERLVLKLSKSYGDKGLFIPHTTRDPVFTIKHFAGRVPYNAQAFLVKNGNTLSKDLIQCLKSSQSELIEDLFTAPETSTGSISMSAINFRKSKRSNMRLRKPAQIVNLSESINSRRRESTKNRLGKDHSALQSNDFKNHNTHIQFFRNSLKELQSAMREANPFFVRCIKPNDKQAPNDFRRDRVKVQLQYNGVEEVARIRTCGFPFRFLKDVFVKKYAEIGQSHPGHDSNQNILNILDAVQADSSLYKNGKSMVFLKESIKQDLDDAVEKKRQEEEKRRKEEERRKKEEEKRRKEEKKRKKEEEKRIEEEERKLKEEERIKKEKEMKTGEFTLPLNGPLDTIVEVPTPFSYVDDPTYNSPLESNSSNNTLHQTSEEDSEEDSEKETPQTENKSEEEKMNAAWDITQEREEEIERRDVHEQPILMLIKFLVYIILFIIILGTFVIEKVSFLLLVRGLVPVTIADKKTLKAQSVCHILLVMAICIPYALGLLITLAKLCFGNFKRPSLSTWIVVFVIENLHALGLCLLVFRVLRHMEVIKSAMLLSATAIIPAIFKFTMSSSDFNVQGAVFHCEPRGTVRQALRIVLDVAAIMAQISVVPLIILTNYIEKEGSSLDAWLIVEIIASFILVSCCHWENFTDGRLFCELGKFNWFKNSVLKIRYELQMGRHYPFLVSFLSKIGLTILLGYLLSDDGSFNYSDAIKNLKLDPRHPDLRDFSAVIALTLSAFVAFYMSFGACMFQMQIISLTIPACLATPVVIGLFYLNCEYDFLKSVTNLDLNATCQKDWINGNWYYFLFGTLWWLSFFIVTRHIWRPQVDRTANMARVFLTPIYCGILTTEFIMLNRRRNPYKVFEIPETTDKGEIISIQYKLSDITFSKDDDDEEIVGTEPLIQEDETEKNPATPMLYACATMWHETRTEMVQLLKSLHRLDRDQYIRKIANENVRGYDPELYNFEAHIFFDDAMEPDDNDEQIPNRWVKELVACMDVACSSVHEKPMKVHPPTKMPTPYGGQLIWEMPGENLLFVHMKDIKKIRNRKRWSQVMYMYYLLGYRHIMASKQELLEKLTEVNMNQGNHGLNVNEINYLLGEESALKAQNTFILALDGDTDFSPGSIKILLDRMKDERVGAACGRIHPIGNGPMVWYQKFEYAIGHWLQKSAEHVFGCVLCSPGCFSLFRAAALMDTNVMKKYTTEPTEPGHHLQYDQGEDRWLCTLMLQQGYRIEYAAAADAWTFAPEGFFEFFNQRRRWMPSTIANILDLLGSSTVTTKRNPNMSIIYIFYQWMLMLMTILGPGTIIMMIAGAAKLVFEMELIEAYLFATIPAAIFIFICFWFNSKIQLIFAGILSVYYSFIMAIVFVGTIKTVAENGVLHPSVVVILLLVSIFIISGLCHPQEIQCLIHGVLYLLTIPTGYLLLVIYSICNLNDVSWGTREVPTKAQRIELEKKKKEKEEQKKNKPKKSFWEKIFNRGGEQIRELTKLVKTLSPEIKGTKNQLAISAASMENGEQTDNRVIELLSKIEFNLKQLLKKSGTNAPESGQLTSVVTHASAAPSSVMNNINTLQPKPTESINKISGFKKKIAKPKKIQPKKQRDELRNPKWAEDKGLGDGERVPGNKEELQFWDEFVKKYLLPIRPTPEEKKKIADGLRELRNSSALAFILINSLWMILNFMFQYTNAAKFTIYYNLHGKNDKIEESVLGLGFVFLLLALMILQTIGMLIHRMGTLQHLLAITQIKLCKQRDNSLNNVKKERNDVIRRIKRVLKLPMTGDAGNVTTPPKLASEGNNWGRTFLPSSSKNIFQNGSNNNDFMENLGKTLSNPNLNRVQNSFIDTLDRNLSSIRHKLLGNTRHRLPSNASFSRAARPHLPPRNRSFHQPMITQNLGFTRNELRKANVNVDREDEPIHFRHLGPIARTLYQKFKIINDEPHINSNGGHTNSVRWGDTDVVAPDY